jgi:hypothetical protein
MTLLTILIAMLFMPCGNGSERSAQLTQDQYEDLKGDRVFLDILSQEMKKEKSKIIRNKVILKNTEEDLIMTVKHGLVEKELCVRQGISSLRTMDYAYNWMLEQTENLKFDDVKLNSIRALNRMRHMNKMFSDRTLKIEECKLKLLAKSKDMKNEMISDRADTKVKITNDELGIPYDYPAARSPFR